MIEKNKQKFGGAFERITQVVGKWEKQHRVQDVKRLTWWYPDFGVFMPKDFSVAYRRQIEKKYSEIYAPSLEVRIANDEQLESGGTWLKLPSTVDELHKVFEQIGIAGPIDEGYTITEFRSPFEWLSERLSSGDSLDELNMLASYLNDMEAWELEKLQAIITSGIFDGIGGAAELIDLVSADNFAAYNIIEAFSAEELGAYWLRELPDSVPGGMTATEYGTQCVSDDKGAFTSFGYVHRRYDSVMEYDGIVPQEYRIVDFALLDLSGKNNRQETHSGTEVESHHASTHEPDKYRGGYTSVLKAIKESKKEPKPPRKAKSADQKHRGDSEL
jgi:hypothetical protein